jgi:glycosyltransferase involved in cell wall biosynthesis
MEGSKHPPSSCPAASASTARPFFSIGVTTYDRRHLLKETLDSIIRQTFPDFEVLVGNDNPREMLSGALLGIDDRRISFINRPVNLGELGNMNALLEAGRGRYFTWLADDDLYADTFLEAVQEALIRWDPPVVYTSYATGESGGLERSRDVTGNQARRMRGPEFLEEYLARSLKVIGCYGVFKKEYLQQLGGMEKLGQGFSPYSDNLLVIKTCLLDQVIYLDAQLLLFRTHEQSISFMSPDLDAYRSAQEDLLAKCRPLFLSEGLKDQFQANLYRLLLWCFQDFDSVVHRSGRIGSGQAAAYLRFIHRYLPFLKGSPFYGRTVRTLLRISAKHLRNLRGGAGRGRRG